jgi:hypothetical protein
MFRVGTTICLGRSLAIQRCPKDEQVSSGSEWMARLPTRWCSLLFHLSITCTSCRSQTDLRILHFALFGIRWYAQRLSGPRLIAEPSAFEDRSSRSTRSQATVSTPARGNYLFAGTAKCALFPSLSPSPRLTQPPPGFSVRKLKERLPLPAKKEPT